MSSPLAKSIQQLDHSLVHGRESSDAHYLRSHTRFARHLLRAMPNVVSYHIARADGELDLLGGFTAAPSTFRYITLRFEPGTELRIDPEVEREIVADHRRFLRNLRTFVVQEQVLVDRMTGHQTSCVKVQAQFDRHDDEATETADLRFSALLDQLTEKAADTFGLRLLVADRVTAEVESVAVDEPGQRVTGELLPSTTRHGFVSAYFDHIEWASEWICDLDVRRALTDPTWARSVVAAVHEECGFDRR